MGQGTFYRHFPSRDALILELYHHEMQRVANAAPELLQTLPPEEAIEDMAG